MDTSKKRAKKQKRKYVFVVGGVISGVGKGVATSSIAKILQSRGLSVTALKIDPYVNVDAGTMNPTEHGEVCVLSDGYETDQDMCNYERFLGIELSRDNYMTTGSVYESVIRRERNLGYKGKCVQVVPHIPLEVIGRITRAAERADADVSVVEVGGTVGEYENILFLEAIRMLKIRNPADVVVVMVSYVPLPSKVGEMKTKPTQHAVRLLNSAGIQPDIIIARSDKPLDKKRKEKISTFCNIAPEHVISAPDVDSIYDIPLNFERDRISDILLSKLGLQRTARKTDLVAWRRFVRKVKSAHDPVHVAIVGKYFETGDFVLSDAYLSVIEAIKVSAYTLGKRPEITWLNAIDFENEQSLSSLEKYGGILVPGGFGERGIAGKLNVIRYARQAGIPYFGICYGMQLMVVEYARTLPGMEAANTVEIDPGTDVPIVDIMADQKEKLRKNRYGGTMRLGTYPAIIQKGTIAYRAYQAERISERHRHRYEINPEYVRQLEAAGLVFSGKSPDGTLMEIVELPEHVHPFMVGVQFHPEFHSRPLKPHPLFTAFIEAAARRRLEN